MPKKIVRSILDRCVWIALEQQVGVNPFKYGVVGGGDIHTSIVSHEEYAHTGEHNLKSGTPHERLHANLPNEPSTIEQGTAGLSCMWAEENTRDSTYDAKALGIDPPADFPATIQERAWTSPIWYIP